ncbi:hypothetical protein AC579_67 [Pseudocercospora musae]|uniref:Uncharacterized protein n=1 Tax=Pseudocercospora musae TaxID=113226 RepID=A0A139IA72_9PEZI|nr:hypothetical protein AC579_67 [Pseudocercospora musae]
MIMVPKSSRKRKAPAPDFGQDTDEDEEPTEEKSEDDGLSPSPKKSTKGKSARKRAKKQPDKALEISDPVTPTKQTGKTSAAVTCSEAYLLIGDYLLVSTYNHNQTQ